MKHKPLTLALACLLLLSGCNGAPENETATTTTQIQSTVSEQSAPSEVSEPMSNEYAIYDAYLGSGDWALMESFDGSGELKNYAESEDYMITATKIFDFDGDGILEMWYKAEHTGGALRYIPTISGFCTIVDGKAERLLVGYISGGSMGGERITTKYNQETSEHVISLSGIWGGFDGRGYSEHYYSMHNGKLSEIESLFVTTFFHDDGYEVIYEVNTDEVSEEAYNRAAGKYIEPVDSYYILE